MTAAPPALDAFVQLTGRAPAGVWAAPGRVNLIGEHTDYNEGLVLPFAIAAHAEVAAGPRADATVRVVSLQRPGDVVEMSVDEIRPETVNGWSAYVLGVVWALRADGHDVRGVDLVLDGRVPVGSGLSSSASVGCASVLALAELNGIGLPRERLAVLAQRSENDAVGAPTGPMDQRAALLCTDGHALLLDTRDMSTEQVPLDPAQAGLGLLVVDSRVHHTHTGNEYGDRRRACRQACEELAVSALRDVAAAQLEVALARLSSHELRRRVRHVVTEDTRTRAVVQALRAGDWVDVGRAMTASHASLRDDFEVSCFELDLLVDTALAEGALGARMTGGGFGGCAIVLAREDSLDSLTKRLRSEFARASRPEPAAFVVRPSQGARRLL